MTTPEHPSIIEDSAADQRRELEIPSSETADPSARAEALGRDDKSKRVESFGHDENRAGAPPLSPEVGDRPTLSVAEEVGVKDDQDCAATNAVKLCLHVKEDGAFCHCAAVGGRQYCYRHLRLRGQQMRMARAIAQRVSYQLLLPPLDDMNAVQSALTHVTAALAAGLLERRRAGHLLYALQQAAGNLRFLARIQTQATLAPQANRQTTTAAAAEPQRVVQGYPEFEAEFGLPPGLNLTLPPQVAFPPPEKPTGWGAAAQTTPQPSPYPAWTKEDIQLEELDKRQPFLSEESYCQQVKAVRDKMHKKVVAEVRKDREAEWEAEAARRNAKEEEKAQMWHSMDTGQQRAFLQGVLTGREEAEEQRRQEELAAAKKPVAKVSGEEEIGAGELDMPEKEAAK